RMEPDRLQEHLESMHRAAERASTLVHDLLDAARIDAGHLQLEFTPVDLGALVREAADMIRPLLAERGQSCDVQIEEGLPPVLADRERLLQVFSNLLGNARKFARLG